MCGSVSVGARTKSAKKAKLSPPASSPEETMEDKTAEEGNVFESPGACQEHLDVHFYKRATPAPSQQEASIVWAAAMNTHFPKDKDKASF